MSRRELRGALASLVRLIDHADSIEQVREGVILGNAREIARRETSNDTAQIPWTPFIERSQPEASTAQIALIRSQRPDWTMAQAKAEWDKMRAEQRIYTNSRYQVAVLENPAEGAAHLSIKRIDQLPVHDWRDLQRIKDELVGPECEAVELYPANSRLVDTSTQYHLWAVRDPTFRFPLGFEERLVMDDDDGPHSQRRRDP